jgi:TetR/AcrR family fatty acid metabolism transcriptional regulator
MPQNEHSFTGEGGDHDDVDAAGGREPSAAGPRGAGPPPPDTRVPGTATTPAARNAREGNGGDKRDRILQAAVRVFAQKGFYATRVSEIARAAGVADGTIYLYFKNKDDVLLSLFDERTRALLDLLRRELAAATGADERLRRVVEIQLGLLEDHRDLAEVITVNLRQSSVLLKQYATPLFREYLALIAGVIEEGQAAGELREDLHPMTVARALWGALDGLAMTWALGSGDPVQLRRAARQAAALFLQGLRRTPRGSA